MEITFSGWEAIGEKGRLNIGEEPTSGRVYTMYHGTYLANAKAIISHGFQASKDGLLGRGVYVSRNIDKAKCYPLKTDKNKAVVFKLKVRVGKVKKIDSDNSALQKQWHQNGYDSAWIPPNCGMTAIKSGREEDCVWDPARIEVVDVALCVDKDTRMELRSLIRQKRKETYVCYHCQQLDNGSDHISSCWACNEKVCPFQKKHKCKG